MLAQQIRRENEGVFEHDHHIHRAVPVVARDTSRATRLTRLASFSRRIDALQSRLQISSSAITTPVRVALLGANSAATGSPRGPSQRPRAGQHRPPGSIAQRHAARAQELLQLMNAAAALGPKGVTRTPVAENQGRAKQIPVENTLFNI